MPYDQWQPDPSVPCGAFAWRRPAESVLRPARLGYLTPEGGWHMVLPKDKVEIGFRLNQIATLVGLSLRGGVRWTESLAKISGTGKRERTRYGTCLPMALTRVGTIKSFGNLGR